jgi:anthranilate synthase
VVHSPGPGTPESFGIPARIRTIADYGIPQFGVCLGLQGLAEAFGGRLGVLDAPRHGKYWMVSHAGVGLFEGLPDPCRVGAYHSLHTLREGLPECLEITAENETGLVMGLKHRDLPVEAVQFHPESILSMQAGAGRSLIRNLILGTIDHKRRRAAARERRDRAAPA